MKPATLDMTEHEIEQHFLGQAATDPGYAIAYALLRLADAQRHVATQIKFLGNGDATTKHGAIEAFGMHLGEKLDALVFAIDKS
jgi:hypothetical protein